MRREEIISTLKRYNKTKLELLDKKQELCEATLRKAREEDSIPGMAGGERVQKSSLHDSTYEAARRCIEIYDRDIQTIEKEIKIIGDELEMIKRWLRALDQNEYKIIEEMYIKQSGKSYAQLRSTIKGYSIDGLKKMRDRALKKIENI